MKLYNTLSHTKEDLPKTGSKPLRLFVCGPTVYDAIHIGNARVFVVFDTLVRFLKSQKRKIKYIQNITDIDDKIIARAYEKKISPKKLAQKYTKIYLKHMAKLGVISVQTHAKATNYIPQIKRQIEQLIEKGYVYKIDNDGWYFDLTKFPDYGKLSGRTVEQAEDGTSRIDISVHKRNRGDFCVWKFSRINEPVWRARFGDGRPGWHIEDTAIAEKFLGIQYELHGGGSDLMFPHHEAEIAQAESLSKKKPYVKIWMHVGMLTFMGKKMGKSLGNFITLDDFLTRHPGNAFRLFVLGAHYRATLDYSEVQIAAQENALAAIIETLSKLQFRVQSRKQNDAEKKFDVNLTLKTMAEMFYEALNDDFNTPQALAVLFDVLRKINPSIWNLAPREAKDLKNALFNCFSMLGFTLNVPSIPRKIQDLARNREQFRISQQFIHADTLRVQINALGYSIEDTPFGPFMLPQKDLQKKLEF